VNVKRDRILFTVPSQVDLFSHASLSPNGVVCADNGDRSEEEKGRLYTVHLHVEEALISSRFRVRSGASELAYFFSDLCRFHSWMDMAAISMG
jgi:hypothetical protein